MNPQDLILRRQRISAGAGFAAVSLGAFGAHGLERLLQQNDRVDTWETAVFYHLTHSILLWILATRPERAGAWKLFLAGIVVFSGSLYLLCLTNIRWLGAITPLGGVALLAGWAALYRKADPPPLSAGDA